MAGVEKAVRRYGPTAVAKYYRPVVAGELKGMDTVLTQASVVSTTNTNAHAVVLNLIQPGTGSWNRVGRKAHLRSLRLIGTALFINSVQAASLDQYMTPLRMVVVWDKQPSGAAIPTFDAIFGITDQNGSESSTVMAPLRYDNMDRFQVLKDSRLQVQLGGLSGNTTGTADNYYYIPFDEYVPLGNRETVFSGQSNPMTIADISTGALYVYFRTPLSIATNNVADWRIDSSSIARLRLS